MKIKERLKEWFKSDFTKALEEQERATRELADLALKSAKAIGIKPLRANLSLFYPNKFYHPDLGVIKVDFEELIELSKLLTLSTSASGEVYN